LLVPFYAYAADTKYAGSFLDLGIGARALSLGGAYVAIADDGSAFYWNPAGLSLLTSLEFDFMHTSAFGSITKPLADYNHLGVSLPMRGGACVSFNYVRLSVDDIPQFPELAGENLGQRLRDPSLRPDGEPLGYFDDKEEAFFFSFAKMNRFHISLGWQYLDFPVEIPIGMNFKLIRQKLHDSSASGFGVDLGMLIRFGFDDLFDNTHLGKIAFGFAISDISGTTISWNTQQKDPIETDVRIGCSYLQPLPVWNSKLLISQGWNSKWSEQQHWGLEYQIRNIFLRAGMDSSNLSFGAGFQFWRLKLSYAYIGRELGNVHRLSGAFLLDL
jgi:hypothetical protein